MRCRVVESGLAGGPNADPRCRSVASSGYARSQKGAIYSTTLSAIMSHHSGGWHSVAADRSFVFLVLLQRPAEAVVGGRDLVADRARGGGVGPGGDLRLPALAVVGPRNGQDEVVHLAALRQRHRVLRLPHQVVVGVDHSLAQLDFNGVCPRLPRLAQLDFNGVCPRLPLLFTSLVIFAHSSAH